MNLKKTGSRKQGHCYSKREEARLTQGCNHLNPIPTHGGQILPTIARVAANIFLWLRPCDPCFQNCTTLVLDFTLVRHFKRIHFWVWVMIWNLDIMRLQSVLTLMSRQIGQPGTDHELGTVHSGLFSKIQFGNMNAIGVSKVVINVSSMNLVYKETHFQNYYIIFL